MYDPKYKIIAHNFQIKTYPILERVVHSDFFFRLVDLNIERLQTNMIRAKIALLDWIE